MRCTPTGRPGRQPPRASGVLPSTDVVVTVIAPNLLFDYLEVGQTTLNPQTPPVVPSPLRP